MASVNYKAEGIVFDIQRFSVHDGPGIRTIVFLKGCPLSCLWCCNPESQKIQPVVMYNQDKCVHCGKCFSVCKNQAINLSGSNLIARQKCIGCGECAGICPTGAITLKGERMTVEEVIRVLKKDRSIYRKSGGGITISGGEPLLQWKFSAELLKACKAQGWNTAMETTGYGSPESVEEVFPFVDEVLLDIKTMDSDKHRSVTGVSNDLIVNNAHRISEIAHVIIRVPTIPTINAFQNEFIRISDFAKSLKGVDTIHILPYHVYGENKYGLLGMKYEMGGVRPMEKDKAEIFKKTVEEQGLRCVIGG